MRPIAAGALVFVTSAAVLVLEIVAARLLAPYVGVTLETYTAIIGTILAAISLGTWIGGRLADRLDPEDAARADPDPRRRAVARHRADRPAGRGAAAGRRAGAGAAAGAAGFFAPAAVLSAVPPTVIKMQLADLAETGRTVGRLSALGTAGAIFGTFATGFVLVATLPTAPIVFGVAIGLILLGGVIVVAMRRSGSRPPRGPAVTAVLLLIVPRRPARACSSNAR